MHQAVLPSLHEHTHSALVLTSGQQHGPRCWRWPGTTLPACWASWLTSAPCGNLRRSARRAVSLISKTSRPRQAYLLDCMCLGYHAVAQVPLLVSLQPAQLSQLAAKMSSEHHDAGATIFSSV